MTVTSGQPSCEQHTHTHTVTITHLHVNSYSLRQQAEEEGKEDEG